MNIINYVINISLILLRQKSKISPIKDLFLLCKDRKDPL